MRAQKKAQVTCDVSVTVDGKSLRLGFPKRHTPLWEQLKGKSLNGKPNYLYLTKYGFSADNPEDWKRATQLAIALEADLDHPEWEKLFDPTLAKYGLGGGKYAKLADVLQLPGAKQPEPEITVGEMWEAYLEWKKTVVEETTFKVRFAGTFSNIVYGKIWNNQTKQYIQSDLSIECISLCDKQNLETIFAKIKSSAKDYFISELDAAFDFCKSKGLLVNSNTENPFDSQKYNLPVVTTQQKYASKTINGEEIQWHEATDEKELESDRRAFTKVERDIVIKSFYESESMAIKRYAPLIEFYFLTGCRTSEALPLTWKDIDFERNLVRFSKSMGVSTGKIKETKTGETRLFYFSNNSRLKELLLEIKGASSNDLIFASKNKKPILAGSVAQAWRGLIQKRTAADGTKIDYHYPGIVTQLAEEGAISGYLSPYHTRHTYITLTAHANAHNNNALLHIASACGNSVDVILRHYLGVDESVELVEV